MPICGMKETGQFPTDWNCCGHIGRYLAKGLNNRVYLEKLDDKIALYEEAIIAGELSAR